MDKLEKIWERIRVGRHTAVIGSLPAELPQGCGFYAVRISCSGPQRALGPMLDARQRVEELLGGPQPILDQAAARVWTGLRRRLLGEVPEVIPGGAIVESLNRLHRQAEGRWAICLDAVEAADEDTLHLLRELLTRPQWLQVPLLLTFQSSHPQGTAAAVVASLLAMEGSEGLVHLDGEASTEIPRREPLAELLEERALLRPCKCDKERIQFLWPVWQQAPPGSVVQPVEDHSVKLEPLALVNGHQSDLTQPLEPVEHLGPGATRQRAFL